MTDINTAASSRQMTCGCASQSLVTTRSNTLNIHRISAVLGVIDKRRPHGWGEIRPNANKSGQEDRFLLHFATGGPLWMTPNWFTVIDYYITHLTVFICADDVVRRRGYFDHFAVTYVCKYVVVWCVC